MNTRRIALLLLVSASFGFTACEEKEDDKTFSAQQCMDKATPATVDACVAMVAGINTQKAYVIRCSADFIRENITNATIIDAIDELDNPTPGTDPTVTLFDNFHFTTNDLATQAVSNCTATGSETLRVLALASQAATQLFVATGGVDLQTWINSFDPNNPGITDQQLEDIGGTISAMAPIACGKGGQFEGNEVCTNLDAALQNGNAVDIAKEFLNQMK